MSNIAEVIGWKFNDQPGMRCKEIDGVLTITEFPGGTPSKKDQKEWTAEYEDYLASVAHIQARKYPSVEEQLDMQYRDAVNGTTEWVDAIAAVKSTKA